MRVGVGEVCRFASMRWLGLAETSGLVAASWLLWCRMQWNAGERRRKARFQAEMDAYRRLDVRLPADGDVYELGRHVSRVVAEKSAFYRVAMLVRGAEGRLDVAGSAGMEEVTVRALRVCVSRVVEGESPPGMGAHEGQALQGIRVGQKSFAVPLEEGQGEVGRGRAIVIPLRRIAGKMLGALVVCADGMMSVRRREVDRALQPLEMLAVKLERAMENAALAERLLRTERLAGLGLLAGGVAHALNSPLTAVLGFAELIAGTSDEERVKADAAMIVREALRMRETLDVLLDFGSPVVRVDRLDVRELVRELAGQCRERLESRGVLLMVEAGEEAAVVRGSRDRLRQLLEHLLNHAAQAVALVEAPGNGEGHSIRMSVGRDGGLVHLIVSDTGPGFPEPAKVFDLVSGARERGAGDGLGLSICYGIVREHGGEISAFNLHPRGGTVVVELPFEEDVAEKNVEAAKELVV